ncbi:hypothetical protein K7X08_016081 [Anisodus acutangulus]|uniref:Peptide chain release factor domain-containing protein n=1 Tax=Anisodus acutangulus TaxID=402998 RepID=A0A9Q1LEK8_9SOLA|nr:hypothetical protein K7X08_016081 [Anisodus acutangulus]
MRNHGFWRIIGSMKSLSNLKKYFSTAALSTITRRIPFSSLVRLYSTELQPQLSIDLIKIMEQRLSAIENRSAQLQRFLDQLRDSVDLISELRAKQKEIEELKTVISECQDDKDMQPMASEELSEATEGEMKFQLLLLKSLLPKDDADERDCILKVRAGTGGEEASLFVVDIFKIKGWKYEVLEVAESDLKGYKEAIDSVSGAGVYGKLKFESGIHRVQVVSLAVSVAILPQADQNRAKALKILCALYEIERLSNESSRWNFEWIRLAVGTDLSGSAPITFLKDGRKWTRLHRSAPHNVSFQQYRWQGEVQDSKPIFCLRHSRMEYFQLNSVQH